MAELTDLEQVTEDVREALAEDDKLLSFFEDCVVPYVEAHRAEIDDDLAAVADARSLTDIAHANHELALGWATLAVQFGREAGVLDQEGKPTDKMSADYKALFAKCSAQHKLATEAYAEHFTEGQE